MRKKKGIRFQFCFVFLSFVLSAQIQPYDTVFIPQPAVTEKISGVFNLSNSTGWFTGNVLSQGDVDYLRDILNIQFNLNLSQVNTYKPGTIRFSEAADTSMDREAYELNIAPEGIEISARKDGAGFFYGIQSLVQCMAASRNPSGSFALPCMKVKDAPRFKWRGMHLDVCRHFFPLDFIKRYIDLLAMYKLNTFHWHLTDDQGWRIEIKKFPMLTRVGAWRKGSMLGAYADQNFDTLRYGGFYTQDEIREVVNYAAQRHIVVVPEIEMPGHAVAAIAAYPFLSCTGRQIQVEKAWGVFNDVFCTKDSVFDFLEQVLQEVLALFPGEYIHIGGDECPKLNWKECRHCQKRLRDEHLKDEHELQSYFVKRIEKFLNSKGKKMIGWDEILEGGLAPKATVMSWRGTSGGIAAAKLKHQVVMSPGKPCYFDHYQYQPVANEPLAIGGYNPLDSVYAFEPVPKELSVSEQKYILGAQGNVWTEYILNPKHVEYMAVPRMCALSEVLWTMPERKNRSNFLMRLKRRIKMLDLMQVNYSKHFLEQ